MVPAQGTLDYTSLGSDFGAPLARIAFAAIKSPVAQSYFEQGGTEPLYQLTTDTAYGGDKTMRDSFFGLHVKPTTEPAPFPEKPLGQRLVNLYFEHTNPRIPILHRSEFMALFERVYSKPARDRTSRELYFMNIVFAIGSGVVVEPSLTTTKSCASRKPADRKDGSPSSKRIKMSGKWQYQLEEYHSSAVVHLESFSGTSAVSDGCGGGMDELQAVLLLAGLALLRLIAPGLWYIIGVAVQLGVDLGLHFEHSDPELDAADVNLDFSSSTPISSNSIGRRQWTRDLKRRLWWCVYSLDRLVSTCVGRPSGIADHTVTTNFPSLLDDRLITTSGFLKLSTEHPPPTYKLISHHYFRLRLLQSEILRVLQYCQAQQARIQGANQANCSMHTNLPSPFLQHFDSFEDWRADVDRRLWEWKEEAPQHSDTGVSFNPLFYELNYWQSVMTLYR